MGVVYLAEDTQLQRKVALKIPKKSSLEDPGALERFYREARAMATVQHAHLCPVYDVGQFEGRHFLTMAYIDGESLSAKLKTCGPLPVEFAVTLLKYPWEDTPNMPTQIVMRVPRVKLMDAQRQNAKLDSVIKVREY